MTEVVAALIWDGDKFMACQRPAHKARGLKWEFVGGKVEPGETKEQALIRECREELAVTVSVGEIFMDVVHEYPDLTVHLTLFNAAIAEGVPQKIEHNDIRWITVDEIDQYEFCPADEVILEKLKSINHVITEDKKRAIAIDGIIDEALYHSAKVKTAFLLKEVNYPDMDTDWHYTDWLYEQAMENKRDGTPWERSNDFHKTFANICRWLAVVESPDCSFQDCDQYESCKHLLAKSAVININKHGGGSSSEWTSIAAAAEANRDLLIAQIRDIAPDLVVCGGTYSFAKHQIFQAGQAGTYSYRDGDTSKTYDVLEVGKLSCGAEFFVADNIVFLEFVHPAWFSVDRKILFAYFREVYHDVLAHFPELGNRKQ